MTRAAEALPDHAEAQYLLAAVHITTGNYDVAIEALERTLKLEPENTNVYKNLGISHYNTGSFAQSRKMFETVLEFLPGDNFAAQWLMRLDREARQ